MEGKYGEGLDMPIYDLNHTIVSVTRCYLEHAVSIGTLSAKGSASCAKCSLQPWRLQQRRTPQ